MMQQINSNMSSDHQPKISNYLNYLISDWLSASTIFKLNHGNLKSLLKEKNKYIWKSFLYHCNIIIIFRLLSFNFKTVYNF